jgi:hypothetical protein
VAVLPDWLTVREAADEVFGVSTQRVHQLIRTYGLETRRFGSGMLLLRRADVDRIAKQERPTGVHLDRQPNHNRRRKSR